MHAQAIGAAVDGQGDSAFTLALRRRLRESWWLASYDLREQPECASLEAGPWSVLLFLAPRWGPHEGGHEAWPAQERIARHVGCSVRSVYAHTATLERAGLLRTRRTRRPDGSERIYYAPGPALLAALARFVERYPRGEGDAPPRAKHLRSVSYPVETVAATPPATVAEEPVSIKSAELFLPEDSTPSAVAGSAGELDAAPVTLTEEEQAASEGGEIAREALAARFARKHPDARAPRYFDAADLAVVVQVARQLDGSRASKSQTMRDAVDGAWAASKGRAPTVRFIFGSFEWFLEHVERGRAARIAAAARLANTARQRALPEPEIPRATPEEIAAAIARAGIFL